ncbi:uncharacterized protein TRIADDRAFT_55991 [Trichoplax adhaerens]|uniref:C-type lectin domain-containing protein n=1 Tax=Trichoplax adhaerens TaxID=10228 RepID=B3RTN8_TRIAD|nr:hypothetical protein TRIADDRAFT_55991 [Trichoplax adhaerens]EDV26163.1 hypothetical protein TRIADDRAFT_55991 [Trichoplax adhaerens]|eukprot:XP_002112196.1 hypothetical protein TRIADDRAFT_55991 [Trichoplax adhaerens]
MVLIYQLSSKTHHYMVLLLTIWIVKRSRYLTNAAATVPICPPNYVLFEGLCYGIENYGQRSFADSESFCANIGGNVVTLNSSQRLAAATSEVLTNKIYWLDLYDVHNLNGPNDFVWLSLNKSTGNYTNWDTDEPNVAGYRCVVIEYIGSSWKWKTRSCSSDARTLCELCKLLLRIPKIEIMIDCNNLSSCRVLRYSCRERA